MRKIFLIISLTLIAYITPAQTKKVLFLGNSYTSVNNTPQICADLAASVNDTLIYESNTPGGYTLEAHSTNDISLNKIAQGNWDFVFLQEQSQRPALPDEQVFQDVFPYARKLDSLIREANPCGETGFFMTWGRKNGDDENCPIWPPVCSYQGMDSLLQLRYQMMADSNQAIISPVAAVWHYLRDHFPLIELYAMDDSHPSQAGSYAAACSFYTTIFRKDPSLLSYSYGLSPFVAKSIRTAAKLVVFDSLRKWHIGEYDHSVDFSFEYVEGYSVQFYNLSQNENGHLWNFGSSTETSENPLFNFPAQGNYPVSLYSYGNCDTLINTQTIDLINTDLSCCNSNLKFHFYPNPAKNRIILSNTSKASYPIHIYNSLGRLIILIDKPTLKSIDISLLDKGVYFIKTANSTQTYKLVVE